MLSFPDHKTVGLLGYGDPVWDSPVSEPLCKVMRLSPGGLVLNMVERGVAVRDENEPVSELRTDVLLCEVALLEFTLEVVVLV